MGEGPWGMVPAPAAQAQTYLAALHPALLRVLHTAVQGRDLLKLQVLRDAAANADTVRRAFAIGSGTKAGTVDNAHSSAYKGVTDNARSFAHKSNTGRRNQRFAKQATPTMMPKILIHLHLHMCRLLRPPGLLKVPRRTQCSPSTRPGVALMGSTRTGAPSAANART